MNLSTQEKQYLLTLARETLFHYFDCRKMLSPDLPPRSDHPLLFQPLGVFVTLKKNGALRGCLGTISTQNPLYLSVQEFVLRSALEDHRFSPVVISELPDLHISINVLSPARLIRSSSEITLGLHGVTLSKRGKSSVFLPQVALEQGWNVTTLLGQLALKAGLDAHDWKKECRLCVFEATEII
jgi:AmmeMemoRadiSam system protein A